MRKIYSILLCVLCLSAVGCSDDKDTADVALKAIRSDVKFSADGGTGTIELSGGKQVSATSDVAWCKVASVLLLGVSLISCGNSSRAKAKNEIAQSGEDFKSFLDKFTSSAAFQYTRIKFPLKTPITLLADDGETEKTFPFTKEKWPLLDSETMKEERIEQEEGGIYVSKFTLNEPVHKVFEAGYEESEIDLRVEFEQAADGKWYVVDCYTGWYGYDLPIGELKQTIQQVKEENAAFKEIHP